MEEAPTLRQKRATRATCICLKSSSKEFENNVTDKRGCRRNLKIRRRENICNRPKEPSLLPQTRALEFAHQQVGIEKEDDKTDLDDCSPDALFHGYGSTCGGCLTQLMLTAISLPILESVLSFCLRSEANDAANDPDAQGTVKVPLPLASLDLD